MKIIVINQFINDENHAGHKRHIYFQKYSKNNNLNTTLVTSNRSYINGEKITFSNIKNIIIFNCFFKNVGIFNKVMSYFEFSLQAYLKLNFSNYEVVITSSPNLLTAYLMLLKAKARRKKFIFEIRDIWPESLVYLSGLKRGGFVYTILKKIERYLITQSNGVVSTIHNFEAYLEKEKLQCKNYLHIPQMTDSYINQRNDSKKGYVYIGSAKKNQSIIEIIETFNKFNSYHNYGLFLDLYIDGEEKSKIHNFITKNNYTRINLKQHIKNRETLIKILSDYKFGLTNFPDIELYNYGISFNKLIDYVSANVLPIMPCPKFLDESLREVSISSNDNLLDSLKLSVSMTKESTNGKIKKCAVIAEKYDANKMTGKLAKFLNQLN